MNDIYIDIAIASMQCRRGIDISETICHSGCSSVRIYPPGFVTHQVWFKKASLPPHYRLCYKNRRC